MLRYSALVLLAACFLGQPAPVSAAAGDEHWSPQFGWPGSTNPVLAIALNNGRLYVGGYASSGLLTNTTLNVWDGIQWSTIGQFSGGNTILYDLAFVGTTLYAAGTFTNVNGAAASGLARWDGNSWSSIGLNGAALALAVEGNNLYVTGVFTNAGSVAITNVGSWDGSAWHALGDGIGKPGNGTGRAIVVSNGTVYLGGLFTNSGPQAITNLAMWTGSTWTSVGGGLNNFVYGLAFNGPDLYVGGAFTQAGSTPANFIAKWDGANWSALGSGLSGGVNSIAILNNTICVAGSFTTAGGISATNFAIWDGSFWSAAGSGLSAAGVRAVSTGTNVYVGGTFVIAGGGIVNQLASWDGNNWSSLGPPGQAGGLTSTVRAIASTGTELFVGGSFTYAGQTNATRIGRYDGTNWYAFGTGLNSNVNAVAVVGTDVYAAGDFTGGAGGPLAYHMAHWNGSQWTALNNTAFASISTLAVQGNDLFIAGYFGITAADGNASWLTRWDGANFWNVLAFDSNTFYALYIDGIGFTSMAIQDTNIYLSGHFSISQCDPTLTVCTNCPNVMRFDGTYGQVMGTGLNSNATAIAVVGTDVYFAGPFTNAGGVSVKGIARWDGNAWSDVGGGIIGRGTITALAAIGTNLYAGGSFTNLGGVSALRMAKWDGTTWSALGSGVAFSLTSGSVSTLTAVGSDLYVGGAFRTAGGKPSYFLGRWNETISFDIASIQLGNATLTPAGPFQFKVTSTGSPSYVIESSTDLTVWTPLFTNSITPYQFIDPNAPSFSRRFYRAHSLP